MKKILFISTIFYVTSLFSQDPDVLLGLGSPAYGVKIKINYPERNSGWSRGFQIVNEDDTKKFISFGGYGGIADGVAHLNYGWIGESYNKTFMIFKPNGNIGIGTVNPQAKLDVLGITFSKTFRTRLANTDYNHFTRNGGGAAVYINQVSTDATKPILRLSSGTDAPNKNVQFTVENNGNVGIGTLTTGSHKLAVEGSVGAREIKVEGSGWSDFVFEKSYKLPSLENVEKHIEEKGHLKDIPSAEEVEKNGFFLGEMDAKLLQKIEELTLYTIQQEKKLKNQNSKIERLEKENKILKSLLTRVSKLEEKIK